MNVSPINIAATCQQGAQLRSQDVSFQQDIHPQMTSLPNVARPPFLSTKEKDEGRCITHIDLERVLGKKIKEAEVIKEYKGKPIYEMLTLEDGTVLKKNTARNFGIDLLGFALVCPTTKKPHYLFKYTEGRLSHVINADIEPHGFIFYYNENGEQYHGTYLEEGEMFSRTL